MFIVSKVFLEMFSQGYGQLYTTTNFIEQYLNVMLLFSNTPLFFMPNFRNGSDIFL